MDWIFTGEYCKLITICEKYFYKDKNNNNKIKCIQDINECPQNMNYLNLTSKECIENISPKDLIDFQFKVKGGEEKLKEISNEIFDYIEFNDFYKEILRKRKIKIEGINSNLLIGTENNLKLQQDSDIGIDFGKCPEKLRFSFGIQNNNELVYKVFEVIINGTKIINYDAYDTDNLETPLNFKPCEGEKITIINPPLNDNFENSEEFSEIINILKDNIEIYNASSPIYNNICYPLSVLNKYDLILRDRREYIEKKKINLCEKGCEYEGDNIKELKVICYCPIKVFI